MKRVFALAAPLLALAMALGKVRDPPISNANAKRTTPSFASKAPRRARREPWLSLQAWDGRSGLQSTRGTGSTSTTPATRSR